MKQLLPLLVVGILVLSGLGAVATINNGKSVALLGDELDQSQTVTTENTLLPVGQIPIPETPINIQAAQSFTPTKEILTRVELFIGKNETTEHPYTVAIREELTGADLTITSVGPCEVLTGELGWVEFNLNDVTLSTDQTYYIVCYTENVTENYYAWGANNKSDSYPFGCAWVSIDDGNTWGNESNSDPINLGTYLMNGEKGRNDDHTWDTCFKTYGSMNEAPDMPTIEGPTRGNAGVEYEWTFYSTDPNAHGVFYWIEWDDGSPAVEWAGEFPSGQHAVFSHTYAEDGQYQISAKAKDIYNLQGDWAYLNVEMPRNRVLNIPFLNFLQSHPNLFPILKYILGL